MKQVDSFIAHVGQTMAVDLMPGDQDPSSVSLPQQPIHAAMFPKSFKYNTFTRGTNPYGFSVDDVKFLGHAGQPNADFFRYTTQTSAVQVLETCLRSAHVAPSAPDTLDCYPFTEHDPFMITETPHVYFAGNQKEFETKLIEESKIRVRLVSIPSFALSPSLVLVNIRTLECQHIQFDVSL